MKESLKKYRIVLAILCIAVIAFIVNGFVQGYLDQKRSADRLMSTVRAVLTREPAQMRKFQIGNELDVLGMTDAQLQAYVTFFFQGYVDPNAEVKFSDVKRELYAPKNDTERRIIEQIRAEERGRREVEIVIKRIDTPEEVRFRITASRTPKGWIVSPVTVIGYLQACYSPDLKLRYKRILDAMRSAKIERFATSSGSWVTAARIESFLAGEIKEVDIYGAY